MSDGEPQTTRVHRALADRRRAQIVDELRARPNGLDAHEIAGRLGLHPNTARWHLGILADAGLVASRPGERTSPGRPRIVYALTESAGEAEREDYRLLATILAGTLSELDDGRARVEEAGRAWGRCLVSAPPPHVRPSDEEALQEIVALLDQQGFRAEAGDGQIRMRRCPFRELAETAPGIVCRAHLGLISGAFAELGSRLEVEGLDAFVEPELCIARLCVAPEDRPAEG